jgi:hypothetical protein
MTQYTELKRLAEAATAGPWSKALYADDCYEIESANSEQVAEAYGLNDAAYIAAASPDVVLSMIAEIDTLRTQNQMLLKEMRYIAGISNGQVKRVVEQVLKEIK